MWKKQILHFPSTTSEGLIHQCPKQSKPKKKPRLCFSTFKCSSDLETLGWEHEQAVQSGFWWIRVSTEGPGTLYGVSIEDPGINKGARYWRRGRGCPKVGVARVLVPFRFLCTLRFPVFFVRSRVSMFSVVDFFVAFLACCAVCHSFSLVFVFSWAIRSGRIRAARWSYSRPLKCGHCAGASSGLKCSRILQSCLLLCVL